MTSNGWQLLPFLAIFLNLGVGGWFVTYGSGEVLADKPLRFAYFYDSQGDSLLRGRFNVPCWSIGSEAFLINGQCYGYFGITPSVFRMPLNFIWPQYHGHWAPLSILTASGIFLLMALRLLSKIRLNLFPNCPQDNRFYVLSALFLLTLGLGSTNIFLLSRPVVYHESILWSVSLALGAVACAFDYFCSGRLRWLLAANFFAMLSVNARPLAGAAALAACGLVPMARLLSLKNDSGEPSPLTRGVRDVVIGAILPVLSLGSYLATIHGKFGTFEGMPIRYNLEYDPERLARLGGSMFHLSSLWWNLPNFFGTAGITPRFPRGMVPEDYRLEMRRKHPQARIDLIEPYMSVTVAMSALLVFAVIGIVGCRKGGRSRLGFVVLCACTAFGPISLLFFASLAYRYFHEFLLLFAFAGAAGVAEIRQHFSQRRIFRAFLVLLVVFNLVLNLEFALRYQYYNTNVDASIPEVRERIHHWKKVLGPLVGIR